MYHEITAEVRWIIRSIPFEGSKVISTQITVLQQKWLDGYDKPYWKDVPTVLEDE